MSESHQREAAIFDAAVELLPEQRAAHLDQACAGDAALRQRIEALLKACERTSEFLDGTAPGVAAAHSLSLIGGEGQGEGTARAPFEKPGDTIGRYKLLQQIGEGGCGVVYMAEQEEPVRRRVALKVIKLGMDTKSVIARFEAERQALAMMDHPNIAKVLDAGATDCPHPQPLSHPMGEGGRRPGEGLPAGRPYFVMELVRGVKITDFCDQNNLSTADRLDLFMQVCRAIQHAHQKGIIHRDIKPSNILVTLHDGVPVPKVIDFGIAKATQGRLTDHTLFTAFEQFLGTPAYTSPEQAEMSGMDIDTRTDIYSLGVLLYELLTGKTPFETKELLAAGLDAMRRTIREKEPVRPSTRLSTMLAGELTTTATRRQTEPPKLIHLVRGDLDWIVMKCLEKDRTRRYETANGLAADIQRHLSQEPVRACPPSAAYRLQKMVRRNKLAFAAVGAVLAALLVGLGVSTWMFFKERAARGRAVAAEQEQARLREQANANARNELHHRQRAEEALTRLQFGKVEELFNAEQSPAALAHLARLLRHQPGNPCLPERLVSALNHRSLPAPLTPPLRHTNRVFGASFSRDDGVVLTWTFDRRFHAWDAVTGSALRNVPPGGLPAARQFPSHDARLMAITFNGQCRLLDARTCEPFGAPIDLDGEALRVQFTADDRHLITITKQGIVQHWDVRTGQSTASPLTLPLGTNRLIGAAFSPDATKLAVFFANDTLRIFSALTGEPMAGPLPCQRVFGPLVSFSPDGRKVAIMSPKSEARLWDATTGQALAGPFHHSDDIHTMHFSPDGERIATGSGDHTVRLWETSTGRPLSDPLRHGGAVWHVEFSPEGLRLATVSHDHTARLWDAVTGRALGEPLRHRGPVRHVSFSHDGRRVVTASDDETVRIWDARPGACLTDDLRRHLFNPTGAWFSPDGKKVVVVGAIESEANLYEVSTHQMVHRFHHEAEVRQAAFSPDGERVATGSVDGQVRIWNARSGERILPPIAHGGAVWSLEFSPNGERLVAGTRVAGIRVWNSRTGEPVTPVMRHDHPWVTSVGFSPDGQRVVSSSPDGTARVWEAETGQQLLLLQHGAKLVSDHPNEVGQWDGEVIRARHSPDGRRIATCTQDGTAHVWNAQSGQPLFPPLHHGARVTAAEFSADGRWLITASVDATARVWSAETGQPLTAPMEHPRGVNCVNVSADRRRFVTGCSDGGVRVWDVQSGQQLNETFMHRHSARNGLISTRFNSDGRWLVSSAFDKAVLLWDVQPMPVPAPAWLAELAEAVAELRLLENGEKQRVSWEELARLKRQLGAGSFPLDASKAGSPPRAGNPPASDVYSDWAKWFFADRSTRTISPNSPITMPQYIQRRVQENTVESLHEALQLSPTNGLIMARLALQILKRDTLHKFRREAEAEWFSKRAVVLAPTDEEVLRHRAEVRRQISASATDHERSDPDP